MIALKTIPLTSNGKVNRGLLKQHPIPQISRLIQNIQNTSLDNDCIPVETRKKTFSEIVESCTRAPIENIFGNSNFLNLGELMSTLRLVNAAQGLGLEINVRDVFQ